MTAQPTILITGAHGLLGPYLVEAASRRGRVVGLSRTCGEVRCDLADRPATEAAVRETRPDIVLHAAAMTDVDACEREPRLADRANRRATANLAAALPVASRLVMFSTDQVYPNTPGPHREGDEGPVNAYGRSKLASEDEALCHPGALVLRTNFFGPARTPGRRSLSDFVADNLAAGQPITLFRDVLFSPLHMATLAELTFTAIEQELAGVYNCGCCHGMSKLDFGLTVAAHLGLSTDAATAGDLTARASRALRGLDLRMDVRRFERALHRSMPSLKEEIAKL